MNQEYNQLHITLAQRSSSFTQLQQILVKLNDVILSPITSTNTVDQSIHTLCSHWDKVISSLPTLISQEASVKRSVFQEGGCISDNISVLETDTPTRDLKSFQKSIPKHSQKKVPIKKQSPSEPVKGIEKKEVHLYSRTTRTIWELK